MKRIILKLICCFCAVFIILNSFLIFDFDETSADEPMGKMSSVYAYILNDYIENYGVISTNADGALVSGNGSEAPEGVIYGDLMSFDEADYPYLILFVADGECSEVSCHIWRYGDEYENAERIAVINKNYSNLNENQIGEFNIAWDDDSKYISYNTYERDALISSEIYTVVGGEAFMYINNPSGISGSAVASFNSAYFRSDVDISDYNRNLDVFFSKLKNTAKESVTYENIAGRISADDATELSRVLIRSALYCDFDIAGCETDDDYIWALEQATASDAFTQLTALYNLDDGIYYAMFDTTKSIYNYALLRKSDSADNGYQILKVRTDCIPLADKELKDIKLDYMSNPLLYDMSSTEIEVVKDADENTDSAVTVKVGDSPAVTIEASSDESAEADENDIKAGLTNETLDFSLYESLNTIRFPAACIAGGIAIALLTILWTYIYSDN